MGWEHIKLSQLCYKITDGSHNPPKGIDFSKYIMLSSKNVFNDAIHLDKPRYLNEDDFIKENKRTDVNENDVLLSIVGTIGRVAVVGGALPKFTLQRSVAVLKPIPDIIDSRFLMYSLQSMLEFLKGQSRGVAQKGIYLKSLREMEINTPPIQEQKRIVTLLDTVFADLEQVRAKTEQNLKNVRELFDSYLQQAFNQKGEGWVETTLGSEINLLTGFAFKSKEYVIHSNSTPLIRGDNIVQGNLRWDGVKLWSNDTISDYEKYQLAADDIVIAMDRTWVKAGMKVAKISSEDLPALLVQRVARLRALDSINSDYLYHLVGSKLFESYVLSIQTGLGVPHISGKQIQSFTFSKPSISQQAILVSTMNKLKHEVNKLESIYQQKLNSIDELKKSILQKAFSGELTHK